MLDRLIKFLVHQSERKYTVTVRFVATLLGVTLFIAIIPAIVWWAGKYIDSAMLISNKLAFIFSIFCFCIGLPWTIAAVVWQLISGRGTPVPVVPTHHFLQSGPYRYVRNPMMLGFFIYLTGWGFLSNHFAAMVAVAIIIALLILEIKFIEERELENRFGDAYRTYKKETPFLLPHWRNAK
jgi:protein-S-isoprenylcysteine O-methyltransferase Ste14